MNTISDSISQMKGATLSTHGTNFRLTQDLACAVTRGDFLLKRCRASRKLTPRSPKSGQK